MKTAVISRPALMAGSASVIVPMVALIPLNAPGLFAVLAGVVGSIVVGFAWADYARKPRFRMNAARKGTVQSDETNYSAVADASNWTCQTISA